MPSTLTCVECHTSQEDMQLVVNNPETRGYLPADIDGSKDYDLAWVLLADDAYVEDVSSGMVLCNECAAAITGDEEDLGERQGQSIHCGSPDVSNTDS